MPVPESLRGQIVEAHQTRVHRGAGKQLGDELPIRQFVVPYVVLSAVELLSPRTKRLPEIVGNVTNALRAIYHQGEVTTQVGKPGKEKTFSIWHTLFTHAGKLSNEVLQIGQAMNLPPLSTAEDYRTNSLAQAAVLEVHELAEAFVTEKILREGRTYTEAHLVEIAEAFDVMQALGEHLLRNPETGQFHMNTTGDKERRERANKVLANLEVPEGYEDADPLTAVVASVLNTEGFFSDTFGQRMEQVKEKLASRRSAGKEKTQSSVVGAAEITPSRQLSTVFPPVVVGARGSNSEARHVVPAFIRDSAVSLTVSMTDILTKAPGLRKVLLEGGKALLAQNATWRDVFPEGATDDVLVALAFNHMQSMKEPITRSDPTDPFVSWSFGYYTDVRPGLSQRQKVYLRKTQEIPGQERKETVSQIWTEVDPLNKPIENGEFRISLDPRDGNKLSLPLVNNSQAERRTAELFNEFETAFSLSQHASSPAQLEGAE